MKTNCQSSGTCLGAMKLCLAIVVCLSTIGYQSVEAVNCTTGSKTDCFQSDFTSTTCEAGQCSCNNKVTFLPIPTGCAAKPQVTLEPDRTPEFIVGLGAPTLFCVTIDTGATISWEKDGTVIDGATSANYTFPNTTAARAGNYVCATALGTDKVKSDPVNIRSVPLSPSAPPVVEGIPATAADGATTTPRCTRIPLGVTALFQIGGPAAPLTATVVHSTTNGQITCSINGTGTGAVTITSDPKPWSTTDAVNIDNATVIITAAAATSSSGAIQYFKTGTLVTATCVTSPVSQNMLVATPPTNIVYTFTDSANAAVQLKENPYTVPPTSGTHTIRCDAKYGTQANKTSDPVTVIFNETYAVVPVLTSNPKSAVVPLGSRLVLTCGDDQKAKGAVTYTWTKGGAVISRQRDRIIQYSKFTQTDVGTYVCTANLPTFTPEISNLVDVKAAANSLHVLGSTLLLALVALASSKIL